MEYSGPVFKSLEVTGGKARLRFEHVGGGLVAKGGGPLKGFAIAGADKRFVFAEAKIDGDLVETTIGQLYYPLTDRTQRFPMPAGGLFSTAHDLARFYQMLLSGGQLDGKRYLSEAAVKRLTSRQTPPELNNSYGFGLAVGDTFFGHGGAYSTNTTADTGRGLILVWLVQHAGFPGEGNKIQDAFQRAAFEAFVPAKK